MHNTEDKQWWVIEGGKKEILFVEKVCPKLGLAAIINPEKKTNPYAPDLLADGQLADLKCQETPFFKSRVFYNMDPQFSVTFNRKDYVRYRNKYPQIVIYFWVDWKELQKVVQAKLYTVQSMAGVWRVPFSNLRATIEGEHHSLHSYQRRQEDKHGNAQNSYLFDLRTFECLWYQGPPITPE